MDIWVDRALYDANFIQSIKSAFHVGNSYGAPNLTLDSFSRVSASAPQSSAVEPHHKAVSAPIPTPASPVTVQTVSFSFLVAFSQFEPDEPLLPPRRFSRSGAL
eukprot:TRINITY_DN5215_c0_g2_i2.p2 TRINITY_DN5215_c0_g2~~TRINITY_DN5215_c0_g2_i2.p2  ORF type:complete len:104 (-),score=25.74 TRINITY_DN5215_c0_g2_i2:212-523(-)